MIRSLCTLAILAGGLAAQVIQAPYHLNYSFVDLGTPPGVPANLGGLTFKFGENDTLYIGGNANQPNGAVYRIGLVRDGAGDITGFAGTATKVADAPYIDGGLQFGSSGVLFFTRYSQNELGMIRPSSSTTDKVVPLTPLNVPSSVGSLAFVPAGFPGTGQLKVVSYNADTFANLTLTPDSQGTFDVAAARVGTQISGGPEGFFFVPPNSPGFQNFKNMVVCEYGSGAVTVYTLDAQGDPVPASRVLFMTGLSGAEGAAIDPVRGTFLFSTYGGNNRVIAIRGFGTPCGTVAPYGQGLAGSGSFMPILAAVGCFARNQKVDFQVNSGLGGAPVVLFAGLQQISLPAFGGVLLVSPTLALTFTLAGTGPGQGTLSFPISVPNDINLLNTNFFFQAVSIDLGAPQMISFSRGVKLDVR